MVGLGRQKEPEVSMARIGVIVNNLQISVMSTSVDAYVLKPLLLEFSMESFKERLWIVLRLDREDEAFHEKSAKYTNYAEYFNCIADFELYQRVNPELFNILVKEFQKALGEMISEDGEFYPDSVNIEELLTDEAFVANLKYAKSVKQRWELLDAVDLLPPYFLSLSDNGRFLRAKTKDSIRKLFGYRNSVVPDLTELGFIEDEEWTEYYLLKNLNTGICMKIDLNNFKWKTPYTVKDKNLKSIQPTGFKVIHVKYKNILGIIVEKHKEALRLHRERASKAFADSHRVKHKKHKQSKPHKKHEYPVKKLIPDSDGVLLTARQYADKYGVSLVTVYKKLKKSNECC